MFENEHSREYGHHLVEEVLAGRMTRRQLLVRASVFGLSATVAGSLLAACGGSGSGTTTSPVASASAPGPKPGGTVRIVTATPQVALNPVTMFTQADISSVEQVCEYLIWVENDFTLRPVLAESWSSDPAAQVWTFKLRQGVTFNNGSPFTADDVVATFERLIDPDSGSAAQAALKGILSKGGTVKADDFTVEFHLDAPFADFPYLVSSASYNTVQLPRDWNGDFLKEPIGTGAFMLTDYTTNQSSTFVKNPKYWRAGLPYLDGVSYVYNPDAQAQMLQMQAGKADLQQQTPYQGSQALYGSPDITVHEIPTTNLRAVNLRVDKAPLDDKRVRQALAYCLDRAGIIAALYKGKAVAGNDQIFAPLYPTSPKLADRAQDYEKAKALLAEAGHPNGVSITITVPGGYLDYGQYATIMQSMCKPAGIDMQIKVMSTAAFWGSGSNQPWLELPMEIVEWSPRPCAAQFIQAMLLSTSVWNSAHWKNAQFDGLVKQYNSTVDESSRLKLATQIGTLQQDETPVILAFWASALRATKANLYGMQGAENFLDLSAAYYA